MQSMCVCVAAAGRKGVFSHGPSMGGGQQTRLTYQGRGRRDGIKDMCDEGDVEREGACGACHAAFCNSGLVCSQ